jgi:hypothetical protein
MWCFYFVSQDELLPTALSSFSERTAADCTQQTFRESGRAAYGPAVCNLGYPLIEYGTSSFHKFQCAGCVMLKLI